MRKIIQIAGSDNRVYALADDNSLWEMNHSGDWDMHPPLPPKLAESVFENRLKEAFLGFHHSTRLAVELGLPSYKQYFSAGWNSRFSGKAMDILNDLQKFSTQRAKSSIEAGEQANKIEELVGQLAFEIKGGT